MKAFFEQLAQGESAGGTTTIGDRAVAGARKMLGLQDSGTAGLVQMVNELVEGQLTNSTTTALIQAVSLVVHIVCQNNDSFQFPALK